MKRVRVCAEHLGQSLAQSRCSSEGLPLLFSHHDCHPWSFLFPGGFPANEDPWATELRGPPPCLPLTPWIF